MVIMDIKTNEVKFNIVDGFVTMQPFAIDTTTREVRYLMVQLEKELVLVNCQDYTS